MDHVFVPVVLESVGTFCGCDTCCEQRQQWANDQPPLLTQLNPADADDC